MTLVYATDLHLKKKRPRKRNDSDYLDALLEKVSNVVEIAADAEASILFGGDLVDDARSLDADVVKGFIEASFGAEWFIVPGNHDMVGGNLSSIYDSYLGVFEKFPWIHLLVDGFDGGNHISTRVGGFDVYPYPYQIGIDSLGKIEVELKRGGRPTIFSPHCMILDHEAPFPHLKIEDVRTGADLVVGSHFHLGWPTVESHGSIFAHPGALCRSSIIDKDRIPKVLLVDADEKEMKIEQVQVGHRFDVFDIKTEASEGFSDKVNAFLDSLEEEKVKKGTFDLEWRVRQLGEKMSVEDDVVDAAVERLMA